MYIYRQVFPWIPSAKISQETPQVGILFGHFATTGDGLHVRHLLKNEPVFPAKNDGNAMEKRPIDLGNNFTNHG